jgi:hypothetical protein
VVLKSEGLVGVRKEAQGWEGLFDLCLERPQVTLSNHHLESADATTLRLIWKEEK